MAIYTIQIRSIPVCNPTSKLVQLGPCLADLLGRVDHVVRRLDPASPLDEVRHVRHDGAHVLGEHDDVVVAVLPLGNLLHQLVLLLCEALHRAAPQGG